MTSAVVVSEELGSELLATPEWHSVSTWQHNVMFEGPEHATEALLLALEPYLRAPALWKRAPTQLQLPSAGGGALVVRNVGALGRQEQAALLRWLDVERKQVISTTAHPLFPMIAQGLFDEALYYRLNVMLVKVDSTGAPA